MIVFHRIISLLTLVSIFGSVSVSSAEKNLNTSSYVPANELTVAMERTFVITAYYSPLPNQASYLMGSYEADIKLNGNGTHGASGKKVFPGMLAAPKSYSFGQYLEVPGVGVLEVSDRGGAITSGAGDAPDRLDIWMGYGDAGLKRALTWGRKTITGTVYPVGTKKEVSVDFAKLYPNIPDTYHPDLSPSEQAELLAKRKDEEARIQKISEIIKTLDGIQIGSRGANVASLQEILLKLGYMKAIPAKDHGKVQGVTRAALIRLQIDHKLIRSSRDISAGVVGPRTRALLLKELTHSDIDLRPIPSLSSTASLLMEDR